MLDLVVEPVSTSSVYQAGEHAVSNLMRFIGHLKDENMLFAIIRC